MVGIFSKFIILAAVIASLIFIGTLFFQGEAYFYKGSKINGVNMVATRTALEDDGLASVAKLKARWIAIIPFAFSRKNEPSVGFGYNRQWFGESPKGVIESVVTAKNIGFNVMIKPHVWVRGDGWPGEFNLETEEAWQQWQNDYSNYILTYAKIADSLSVDLLCIGTEFRIAARERPDFWYDLIKKVRKVYKGNLTYAANWDNIEQVDFWDKLDYIGIDAYFPLTESETPSVDELKEAWQIHKETIEELSLDFKKPVLFTEYGYKSSSACCASPWEEDRESVVNMPCQRNGYEALFATFWQEEWFAGGFLWKWFPDNENSGGVGNNNYTPQNKLAEQVIRECYGR
ncbi:MAG: hypothetical protein O2887_11715 [Bacteroidetes bacterium]|nr:hypothetical protein [Bacteroidota bacterium]